MFTNNKIPNIPTPEIHNNSVPLMHNTRNGNVPAFCAKCEKMIKASNDKDCSSFMYSDMCHDCEVAEEMEYFGNSNLK